MSLVLLLAAAVCAVLGLVVGSMVGRYFSKALLYAFWVALGVAAGYFIVQSLLPTTDWTQRTSDRVMAYLITTPAFLFSLLGGRLGLRQKGRVAATRPDQDD